MAFVARSSDALNTKAREQLQRIYRETSHSAGLDFDGFLKSLPPPEVDPALRESEADAKPSAAIEDAIQGGYAGSAACRSCHQREYETWRQTGMARMLREYRAENLIGDFSPGTQFKDESEKTVDSDGN